jgi:hypothetical protein
MSDQYTVREIKKEVQAGIDVRDRGSNFLGEIRTYVVMAPELPGGRQRAVTLSSEQQQTRLEFHDEDVARDLCHLLNMARTTRMVKEEKDRKDARDKESKDKKKSSRK